jgi:hypothetical protein
VARQRAAVLLISFCGLKAAIPDAELPACLSPRP